MKHVAAIVPAIIVASVLADAAHASFYARTGWVAELQTHFHGVSGTVTILDENTVRVDDFSFDGSGISVFFYLGVDEASFASGVGFGDNLLNPSGYDHVDLGEFTVSGGLDGWDAVSVWCVPAQVNFGSGTFAAPPVLLGDANNDGVVDAADLVSVEANFGTHGIDSGLLFGDADDNGRVDAADWLAVERNFGAVYEPPLPIPEPAVATLLLAVTPVTARRRTRREKP